MINFSKGFLKLAGSVLASLLTLTGTVSAASAEEVSPRIVGGYTATIADAPWQVALIRASASNNYQGQFCSGSLISTQWIVTAAHCVDDMSASDVLVQAGSVTLSQSKLTGRQIAEIIVHPNWTTSTFRNDIALLRLDSPVTPSAGKIQPIKLPSSSVAESTFLRVTGWGATDNDGESYPTTLRKTSLRVLADSACSNQFDDYSSSTQLCAGLGNFDVTSDCTGDSGGPLSYQISGTWYLAGLVSYGSADGCISGSPSVETRVSGFTSWISENTRSLTGSIQGNLLLPAGDNVYEATELVVTQDKPGNVSATLINQNGQNVNLGTKSLTLRSGLYTANYPLSLSNPLISGLGQGTYRIEFSSDTESPGGSVNLNILNGNILSATVNLDSTSYYPFKDGYLDSIDVEVNTLGAGDQFVPFKSASVQLYVDGQLIKSCSIGKKLSGYGSCALDVTSAPLSLSGKVRVQYEDLNGSVGVVESEEFALRETTISGANISSSEGEIYPVVDNFLDSTTLSVEIPTSIEGEVGLLNSKVTVSRDSKVVFTWKLTKSGAYSKKWNGKDGSSVKPGIYTATIYATGGNGQTFTASVDIVVNGQSWKNKSKTVTHSPKAALPYYVSYDDEACTYSGSYINVYTWGYGATCYGNVSVPSSARSAMGAGVDVKVTAIVRISNNTGLYCGTFEIAETTSDEKDICSSKTYTWNMGYIMDQESSLELNFWGGTGKTKYRIDSIKLIYSWRILE